MPLHAPIEQAPATPAISSERQLGTLLHTVGTHTLEAVGWIRVTGSDRVRWLNGMVTNSIQALNPGEANYSFVLNAQGQIQADLTAFAQEDCLLLQTSRDRVPAVMAMFDRFIIMDDVELEDISATRFGLQIAGPRAADVLTQIGLHPPATTTPSVISLPWSHHSTIQIVSAYSPLVPRYELWTGESTYKVLQVEVGQAATTLNGGPVDFTAIENLRILEGTPRYGTDIREKHLAQETGQTRALHFSKGCYLGQEIVERIRSRGNVHRIFTAFRLDGPLPPPGTILSADDKPIAELTSVAAIPLPTGILQIGLGLARREPIERAATITYTTDTHSGIAVPVELPIEQALHPR